MTTTAKKSVYAAAILMGSGCSVMLVTSLAMTADLIGSHKASIDCNIKLYYLDQIVFFCGLRFYSYPFLSLGLVLLFTGYQIHLNL